MMHRGVYFQMCLLPPLCENYPSRVFPVVDVYIYPMCMSVSSLLLLFPSPFCGVAAGVVVIIINAAVHTDYIVGLEYRSRSVLSLLF